MVALLSILCIVSPEEFVPLAPVPRVPFCTAGTMNICKVGNQTSSQDPHAVNSRIFVGNLNTFQVNKIDVEKVFQRYGRIVGKNRSGEA